MNQVVHKRRHRVLLDVTFKVGYTYSQAVDQVMVLFDGVDLGQIQVMRPMDYRKVLTTAARLENEQIRLDLEMAMDAIREAKNKL